MRWHRQIVSSLLLVMLLSAACGDSTENATRVIDISDEQLSLEVRTWINQLGLATNLDLWRDRLERACTEGVWDRQVASRLAEEFINEDLALSVRDENLGPPSVGEGAQALWLMAVNVCRDAFPESEIERGPP